MPRRTSCVLVFLCFIDTGGQGGERRDALFRILLAALNVCWVGSLIYHIQLTVTVRIAFQLEYYLLIHSFVQHFHGMILTQSLIC
jgi:hypothetical protein